MKVKSRDFRKLTRARNKYSSILNKHKASYSSELLMADLYLKSVCRWYFAKYPIPLPKIKYNV